MNITNGLNAADGGSFAGPAATVTFLSTRCRAGPLTLPPGPGHAPQHGLSSKNMALITSDYGKMRSLSIKWT